MRRAKACSGGQVGDVSENSAPEFWRDVELAKVWALIYRTRRKSARLSALAGEGLGSKSAQFLPKVQKPDNFRMIQPFQ